MGRRNSKGGGKRFGCVTVAAVFLFIGFIASLFDDSEATTSTRPPVATSSPTTPSPTTEPGSPTTPSPTTEPGSPEPSPTTPEPTTPEPGPSPSATPIEDAVTLEEIIDGDTIRTSAGTVRIIGIDTPERGECGYFDARDEIAAVLALGDQVFLELPNKQNDEDRYGRLIRYVTTVDGIDIGLMQLEAGHAVARYDSHDGYPEHPREAEYHAAQIATSAPDGSVIADTCEYVEYVEPDEDDAWWTQYGSCSKLKKNTVGHPTGPFNVNNPAEEEIYNWFQYGTGYSGDGDGDGLACE